MDPRTILKTPAHAASTDQVAGGEYLHLGVEQGLVQILLETPADEIPDIFEVDLSTDEASLDKSSKVLMWPIQISIANMPRSSPQIVRVFKDSRKPTNASEFLKPSVDELLRVIETGIVFNFKQKFVDLRCFVADGPA
ncbi:uncharacterized protein LOC107981992 isoform X1 [Nasonia vitripennis]|uniref:Uncharacterized protein n=1 Tax=Nasonia vitripennis TaxID=7425 RepID=A0A7M7IUD1_NASVI|nr:uncharacterized protein LOC107981992 isoform X1 [Nasonia vitripennis]